MHLEYEDDLTATPGHFLTDSCHDLTTTLKNNRLRMKSLSTYTQKTQ
jgi:hypothetical protein